MTGAVARVACVEVDIRTAEVEIVGGRWENIGIDDRRIVVRVESIWWIKAVGVVGTIAGIIINGDVLGDEAAQVTEETRRLAIGRRR